MQYYQTKAEKIPGTDFKEIYKKSRQFYSGIEKRSKRRAHVRSRYFRKNKIFLGLFWQHIFEKKNYEDQMRRMKFLPCAIELIQNSHFDPISGENPNKKSEMLHRFYGQTPLKEVFVVQIKEDKNNGEKFLISVFPVK